MTGTGSGNIPAENEERRAMKVEDEEKRDDGEHQGDVTDAPPSGSAVRSGLMQLSAVAVAARPMPVPPDQPHTEPTAGVPVPPPEQDQAPEGGGSDGYAARSPNGTVVSPRPRGPLLPAGWEQIRHDSGLSCFINPSLQLVSWSRPYILDENATNAERFTAIAKSHIPPLSIFTCDDGGSLRTSRGQMARSDSRKRKFSEVVETHIPQFAIQRREDAVVPLIEVDGTVLDSPEGKTVHIVLRELAMKAWKAVPQYNYSRGDDSPNSVSCSVKIGDKEYPVCVRSTKPLAKEAAAEAVLEEHLPGYWMELKSTGYVGKQAQPPQLNPTTADKKLSSTPETSMSPEDFKKLSIGDPRVLQACMDLCVKTPAQVLQEYQNRNRGISINYNTIPLEKDGLKLFKTIVSSGSTTAEGVATTKKVAKQLGAQSLLNILHNQKVKTYHEVAELYSSANKGAVLPGGSDQTIAAMNPLKRDDTGRFSPSKKQRRNYGPRSQGTMATFRHDSSGSSNGDWDRSRGYGTGSHDSWQRSGPTNAGYNIKRERGGDYAGTMPAANYGGYYGGAEAWGYNRPAGGYFGYSSGGYQHPVVSQMYGQTEGGRSNGYGPNGAYPSQSNPPQ